MSFICHYKRHFLFYNILILIRGDIININPQKLARSIFRQTTELEQDRIKNNIINFGESIFKQLNYNNLQREQFKTYFLQLYNEKRGH